MSRNKVLESSLFSCLFSKESLGMFNESYFQIVEDLVQRLGSYGIYTLLDMHEDILSSKFCLYDGVPLWLINKMQQPTKPFPWPLEQVRVVLRYYFF